MARIGEQGMFQGFCFDLDFFSFSISLFFSSFSHLYLSSLLPMMPVRRQSQALSVRSVMDLSESAQFHKAFVRSLYIPMHFLRFPCKAARAKHLVHVLP